MIFVAVIRLILFLFWSFVTSFLQLFVLLICGKSRASFILPKIFHKGVCFILGIKVIVKNNLTKEAYDNQTKRIVYLSNHMSYLDIPVLGSLITGCFVSKDDVKDWPLFGWLSKLQHTIFIKRTAGGLNEASEKINERMNAGMNIILFPEGTSSDGKQVLDFKSSLFEILIKPALGDSIAVQPVTLSLGKNINDDKRNNYAWYGDMGLSSHLWSMANNLSNTVTVTFHDIIFPEQFDDRKHMAKGCRDIIASVLYT